MLKNYISGFYSNVPNMLYEQINTGSPNLVVIVNGVLNLASATYV